MAWHQLTEWASPWPDDPDLRVCFGRDGDSRVMVVHNRQGSEIYCFQPLAPVLVTEAPEPVQSVVDCTPPPADETPSDTLPRFPWKEAPSAEIPPPPVVPEEPPPLVAEPAVVYDETLPPVVEKPARNVWMLSTPPPDADEPPSPESVPDESLPPVVPDENPPPEETPRQTPPPDIWADVPVEGEEVKAPQFRERTVVRPFPSAAPIGAVDDAGPVTMLYAQSPFPQEPTKGRHGRVTRWFYAQLPFARQKPKRRRRRVIRWLLRIIGVIAALVLLYLIWAAMSRAGWV
jgi:hypothetical protein